MADRPKLILIDGHALAYRAYHALPPDLATSRGELTNAVFGFTSMLLKVWQEEQPDCIAVAFDRGRTFRHEMYKEYKAHRDKMPEPLGDQMTRIEQVIEAFNIPVYTAEGYEADDVLGALARQAEAQGAEVLIVTGDTDIFQLIDEHIRVLISRRRFSDTAIYDKESIRQRYGLEPEQLVDYKAIVGDPTDNIPGVRGVGKKTAAQLLQKYGSLEEIYNHLDEIPSARFRKALEEGREKALLSQRLGRIRTDVPVKLELETCRAGAFDRERVIQLFQELEFRSLLSRLPEPAAQPGQKQASIEEAPKREASYTLVDSLQELERLVERLTSASALAFDVETTSTDAMAAKLVGLAITTQPGEGYYIPLAHKPRPRAMTFNQIGIEMGKSRVVNLDWPMVREKLRPIFADERVAKYAHNGGYDLIVLRRHGLDVANLAFDTMIAEWLIDPASRNLGLKYLAWTRLGVEMTPISELIGTGRKQTTIDHVPPAEVAAYAGADVDMTFRLVAALTPELKERELWPLFTQVEMPLVPILADMEMTGICVDRKYLEELSKEFESRLSELEEQIWKVAGERFNINSTQQLSDILFLKLKLPKNVTRRMKSGHYSTAADVLEKLRGHHPIVDLVLEYRELAKLRSTYVDSLCELINPVTGRVHTSYKQTGTVTGRLSCLPAGTLVNTQRGLVGIETVRPGDLIRTPYGPRRVLDWQATGQKPVVVLKLSNGITLRCSPDHRLRSKGKWLKASDITTGTPVYMSFAEGLFGTQVALDLDYTTEYRTQKTPTLPGAWTVDFAELVGYVLADGHICRSNYNNKPDRVVLSFGWDDEPLIHHFEQIIERTFGKPATRRLTKSCPILEVSGVDIGGALEQLGAGGPSGKIRVPPSIFRAPKPIVAAFLRGYFEGDGHVGEGIEVRSTSLAMLEDVQQLLTLFGIPSSITKGTPDPRGYARRYTLRIVGDRSKRFFHDHIGFLSPRKREACAKLVATCSKKSTAELLTLPDGFDIEALKPYLYPVYRGSDGRVPQAITVFTHKFVAGRQTITLPRAEWMVDSLPDGGATPEADFLREAAEGQYYEVKVTEISYEAPVPMYDIAVEEVEQYIAQGIVVHNSSNPNLQNIPIRTELGRRIRGAFHAQEGWWLLGADYSQVELRILAHISQDPALLAAFHRGEDIHRSTAAAVYGVPLEEVTPEMRRVAKTTNFAIVYGVSGYGLAQQTGLSQEEATAFIETYFKKYPKVKEYVENTKRLAAERGYVETLLGRRRYFPELVVKSQAHAQVRRAAERMAINTPIQGSSADIIKLAMINLDRELKSGGYRSRMLLQVHDELVLEVPEDELDTMVRLVPRVMSNAYKLAVPLKVDVKVGRNWLEMEEVELIADG